MMNKHRFGLFLKATAVTTIIAISASFILPLIHLDTYSAWFVVGVVAGSLMQDIYDDLRIN